jgi:predicted metal-dependent phosphoesterase TrpH
MVEKKANFHLHTYYSDGAYTPRQILRFAKNRGFSAIAVTDHNEIRGTLKVFDLAPEYEMIAYLGIELFFQVDGRLTEMLVYFTEKNDIVAFMNEFRSEEFYPKYATIDVPLSMVKRHRGVAIAPHPFGHKGILGHNVEPDICGVEVANSFITKADNRRARQYVDKNEGKYKEFGGADLHIFPYSFNCAHTLLKSEKEIDFDILWENMQGKREDITFEGVGGSLPLWARIIQECWCLVKASIYLALQNREFARLHNFHNFHSHHTTWDDKNNG